MGMLLWLPAWVNQCDNRPPLVTPLPQMVHTSGVEIAPPPMTTQIQQATATFFNLTTVKGKEVGVSISGSSVHVYIQRNGLKGLSMGRHFFGTSTQEAFLQAIDAYKAADIKAALRALLSELI